MKWMKWADLIFCVAWFVLGIMYWVTDGIEFNLNLFLLSLLHFRLFIREFE